MIIDNKSYTGDGSTKQFATSVFIASNSHIAVFLDNELQPTNSYDLLGSIVLFETAPSIGVAINFVVSDTGEDLPSAPNDLNAVATNIEAIKTVNNNIDNIIEANNNSANITTVADNIDAVNTVALIDDAISVLAYIENKLVSIYNDKAKLDSIFADKSKLDSIFADKSKLDSIYGDKSKLDSIYAKLAEITTIYNNLSNVNTTATNIADVNTVASNIVNINTFSNRYKISATEPIGVTEGTLWYDTVNNVVKYYNGTSWVAVTPDLNAVDSYLGSLITEVLI